MPHGLRVSAKFLALSLLLGAPMAADGPAQHLSITSVTTFGGVLVIRGQEFGRVAPLVTLGGIGLAVTRISREELRAPIPPGTAPGTYPLRVASHPGRFLFDSIDVTIGTVGPAGAPGQKGDKGDPGNPGLPGTPGLGLETGQIRGQLVACTPRSFDGVQVYVPGRSFSATTGATGSFELSYLPPGTYELAAAQAGSRLVTVPAVNVSATLASDLGEIQTTKLDTDRANCGVCGNACGPSESCTSGACICSPTTCAAHSWNCGTAPDGCGGTLNCGTCSEGLTCGGDGTPNRCERPSGPCDLTGGARTNLPYCP